MERDPHLPHPEVCDWLLRQEWSAPDTVDCCEASTAIGRDETLDLVLPSFGLKVLREDQAARAAALESEATDPRTFDGLKTRIVTTSSQAVNVNGALSLGLLDELMDAVDSGSGEKECAAPEDPVDDDAEPGLDALNELIGRLLNAIRDADATIPVSIAALEAAKTLFLSQVYDLRPRFEE
jgi:hypothetical protein